MNRSVISEGEKKAAFFAGLLYACAEASRGSDFKASFEKAFESREKTEVEMNNGYKKTVVYRELSIVDELLNAASRLNLIGGQIASRRVIKESAWEAPGTKSL